MKIEILEALCLQVHLISFSKQEDITNIKLGRFQTIYQKEGFPK